MPKKVATRLAHKGAAGLDWSPVMLVSRQRWLRRGRSDCTQGFADESSDISSKRSSPASCTGDEITYAPLAHFPRSIWRQWSLQKGKSGFALVTFFLQIGQRRDLTRLRTINFGSGFREDLCDQVVIVRFGDLASIELARLRFDLFGHVVYEDFTVNLRRVHGSASLKQQVTLLRCALK